MAFQGVSFMGSGRHKWSVQFDGPRTYVRAENQLKEDQLAKGGARLGELLNEIWP
jgi:hypothetical protein